MLINVIMRKMFGFVLILSKVKKKKLSVIPIAGEGVGQRISLNIPGGKAYCSICSY